VERRYAGFTKRAFCKFGGECKFAHPTSGDVILPKGKSVVAKVSLEDRIKKLEGEVGRDAPKRSRSPQEPKSRALAPGVCRFMHQNSIASMEMHASSRTLLPHLPM
jgi:hypothetical protein